MYHRVQYIIKLSELLVLLYQQAHYLIELIDNQVQLLEHISDDVKDDADKDKNHLNIYNKESQKKREVHCLNSECIDQR